MNSQAESAFSIHLSQSNAARTWRAEHLFYCCMTSSIWLVMLLGFARTFYLSAYFGTRSALTPLLVVHGAVMTVWMTLLIVQSSLIAAHRMSWHRVLGIAGSVLAALLTLLMIAVTYIHARKGMAAGSGDWKFLFNVSMASPLAFAALMLAAVGMRRRGEYHKRLVILAAVELVSAALARLPVIGTAGAVGFFGASDLFVLALLVHDLATSRRVHPATAWGGGLLVLSQPIRALVASQPAVLAFAAHLVR